MPSRRRRGPRRPAQTAYARGAADGMRAHRVLYRADGEEPRAHLAGGRWVPSILMPRWASRLTLRVVSLRREHCAVSALSHRWAGEADVHLYNVADEHASPGYTPVPHPGEPLPWVDDAEARREGVADRAAYLALWESINGPEYPTWVWRIEFERVTS